MSACGRRRDIRWAMPAAVCAVALFFAPLPAASTGARDTTVTAAQDTISRAEADTGVAVARDTIARIPADTSAATLKRPLWTMDELKRVLADETGGLKDGKVRKERKNGRIAMACAVLVPGLGQMYNEKPLKAAIALGLESYYVSQIVMNRRLREREKIIRDAFPAGDRLWKYHDGWVTEYWERSVDWIWWSGAVILAVVIDAYVDAKLDDMRFKVEARASEGDIGLSLLVRY